MNEELMCNKDFIRCSALIAELLMKYKRLELMEIDVCGEPENGSPLSFFIHLLLIILLSSYIINHIGDYY